MYQWKAYSRKLVTIIRAHWANIHLGFNFLHVNDRIGGHLQLPGLSTTVLERSVYYGRKPLYMILFESDNGIRCLLRSTRELLSAETIQWLLDDYNALLRRVVTSTGANERLGTVAKERVWTHGNGLIGE